MDSDVSQFKEAFDAYEGDSGSLPDKYYRKFLVLRHKIVISIRNASFLSCIFIRLSGKVFF